MTAAAEPDVSAGLGPVTLECAVCGNQVPPGEFCGACGALLSPRGVTGETKAPLHPAEASNTARRHAFAANPAEHVFHLSVITTLLPHLPHRRTAPFRMALLLTAAVLLLLGFLRLTAPAVAVASLAVPLIYMVYLHEVEVYEDEPLRVIGATYVLGLLIGIPWAVLSGPVITNGLLLSANQGPRGDGIVISAAIQLVAQALMLAGPAVIYVWFARRRFDEALDGFSFGVATALGFTFSTTLVELFPNLGQGLVSATPVVANVLEVLQRGLLIPIIHACTTGLVAGSFWLHRGPVLRRTAATWSTAVPVAVAVAAAVQITLGVVDAVVIDTGTAVGAYAVVAVLLLLWVRLAIHRMLLAESAEVTIGPQRPCSHCHRLVPGMAFCPHCGVASRSAPKRGGGLTHRPARST